ncbi:MAG: CopC domain, partial [Actinomycetota bacterium]|nr:CopC domain [Actinomycetota bacterium]
MRYVGPKLSPMRAFAAALLLVCLVAAPAWGHAAYKGSDPADESSVTSSPSEIWAEYTEPPGPGSHMEVFDPCGDQVDGGDSRYDGYKLYVSMSGTHSGTYRATWFVNSAADSHSTRGEFTFAVTQGEPCPGAAPRKPKEPRSKDKQQKPKTTDEAPATDEDQDQDAPVSSGTSGGGGSSHHHHHHRGVAGNGKNGKVGKDPQPSRAKGEGNGAAAPVALKRQTP